MIAWNFQKIVGTCQFRVPWFGYPCGYSSLTTDCLFPFIDVPLKILLPCLIACHQCGFQLICDLFDFLLFTHVNCIFICHNSIVLSFFHAKKTTISDCLFRYAYSICIFFRLLFYYSSFFSVSFSKILFTNFWSSLRFGRYNSYFETNKLLSIP